MKETVDRGYDWKISFMLSVLLFLGALAIRLLFLNHPGEVIFDEFYYVDAARMIILGEGDPNWVHPPVGKYFIGLGIATG